MSRRLAPVLALVSMLVAASAATACEDDPDDLDYLKAGSGGSTTAGKGGSSAGTSGKAGASAGTGKAGASADADAG